LTLRGILRLLWPAPPVRPVTKLHDQEV